MADFKVFSNIIFKTEENHEILSHDNRSQGPAAYEEHVIISTPPYHLLCVSDRPEAYQPEVQQ